MKTTLLLLLTCAFANAEILLWNKNPEPTVIDYQASYGTSSGRYNYHLPKGPNTSVIVPKQHLANNTTYYFTVVAFDEKVCAALDIPVVPMVERQVPLTFALIDKYSIEMNHINGQRFEGVVMKHNGGSFKIINLDYDTRK